MRKIVFLFVALIVLLNYSFSQIPQSFSEVEGYGRFQGGIVYDLNNENILYASTRDNQILISENKGMTWSVFYSSPNISESILHLRQYDENTLVFTKTNSGLHTTTIYFLDIQDQEITEVIAPTPNMSDNSDIYNYDVAKSNMDIIFVTIDYRIGLANYNRVYLTTNGGNSWNEVYYNEDNDGVFVNNVAINPTNHQILYILRGSGPNGVEGGILLSTDGGQTWEEKLPGTTFRAIDFAPNNSDMALLGTGITFGTSPEIVFSTSDAGITWTEVSGFNWTDYILNSIWEIKFNPYNPNHIVILEENEVVISFDGGVNWNHYVYSDNDSDNTYTNGFGVTFNPTNHEELIINGDFRVFRSLDGGVTLSKISTIPFFMATFVGLNTTNNKNLYYGLQGGILHQNLTSGEYSLNGGGAIGDGFFPFQFHVDNAIEGRIFRGIHDFTTNWEIELSLDHGTTFDKVLVSGLKEEPALLTTSKNDPNILWAAIMDKAIKIDITDINNPVSVILNPLESENPISGIFIDNNNSNHLILAYGKNIYVTNDAGDTWENVITLPHVVIDIFKHPDSNEYLAATTGGIFKSIDLINWELVFSSSNMFVNISYSSDNPNLVIAGSATSNISNTTLAYSTDAGNTWTEINQKMLSYIYTTYAPMVFSFSSGNIADCYMHTSSLGIVNFTLDFNVLVVNNKSNTDLIQIYPNPNNGNFNINSKVSNQIKKVEIFGMSGIKLMEFDHLQSINISHLSDGAYFIVITKDDNNKIVKKVLKK